MELKSEEVPTMVHTLRADDIKYVAAMGDALTAVLGAHAITHVGLFSENRGVAWSIGGDEDYERLVSLPNILRQYNPALKAYSTGTTTIFPDGQNATRNRLNVGWY